MRTLSAFLAFSLAVAPFASASSATESDAAHASSYLKTLPNIPPPVIDAAHLVTPCRPPASCIDHPHGRSRPPPRLPSWVHDLPSAAPSTTTTRRAPSTAATTGTPPSTPPGPSSTSSSSRTRKMALAPIIRQRASTNISPPPTSAGEAALRRLLQRHRRQKLSNASTATLGFFKIYGELASWNDPDAKKLTANLEPLNKQPNEKYIPLPQAPALSHPRWHPPQFRPHHELRARLHRPRPQSHPQGRHR